MIWAKKKKVESLFYIICVKQLFSIIYFYIYKNILVFHAYSCPEWIKKIISQQIKAGNILQETLMLNKKNVIPGREQTSSLKDSLAACQTSFCPSPPFIEKMRCKLEWKAPYQLQRETTVFSLLRHQSNFSWLIKWFCYITKATFIYIYCSPFDSSWSGKWFRSFKLANL